MPFAVSTCFSLLFLFLFLFAPTASFAGFITSPDELNRQGVSFTWSDVRSKTLRIVAEYSGENGTAQQVSLGSGFLISPDGLFVTAYHVMKFCLSDVRTTSALASSVDCSNSHNRIRYRAYNGERPFDIEVVSHLSETDSTSRKDVHTPDEIIKQRDFIIAKLRGASDRLFSHWQLRDYEQSIIDPTATRADFQLIPLRPPKQVFIAGYPKDRDLVISEGFLNLTEKQRRGYFAANYDVYSQRYLQSYGLGIETRWGMGVQNHMSGGPVVDSSGYVVGVVVNGNDKTAGVLSIENVLSTFFSRSGKAEDHPAVLLSPTQTPLYLRY
jgi:S1-C subfamily serine protease